MSKILRTSDSEGLRRFRRNDLRAAGFAFVPSSVPTVPGGSLPRRTALIPVLPGPQAPPPRHRPSRKISRGGCSWAATSAPYSTLVLRDWRHRPLRSKCVSCAPGPGCLENRPPAVPAADVPMSISSVMLDLARFYWASLLGMLCAFAQSYRPRRQPQSCSAPQLTTSHWALSPTTSVGDKG